MACPLGHMAQLFNFQVSAMQRDSSTYCDEPEDTEDFNSWKESFKLDDKYEIARYLQNTCRMSIAVKFWKPFFYIIWQLFRSVLMGRPECSQLFILISCFIAGCRKQDVSDIVKENAFMQELQSRIGQHFQTSLSLSLNLINILFSFSSACYCRVRCILDTIFLSSAQVTASRGRQG